MGQETYKKRHLFLIQECVEYFMQKEVLERVQAPDYCPTLPDVLRVRLRTSGIIEQNFVIPGHEDSPFLVVDVGGQRNERAKWLHCFDEVTAVIFVAALSAYDQVLFEDDNTNRMEEALKLWKDICRKQIFKDKAMILFLNKKDLFEEKIKIRPLSVKFPEFKLKAPEEADGKSNLEQSQEFIKQLFLYQNKLVSSSRTVYVHYTNATDTDLVQKLFEAIQHVVIKKSFELAG